jgi:L-iditol 2-dehydrogenase
LTINEDDFVFKLPESITFEEGTFFEPLSACTHAVLEHSGIKPADIVMISGPGSMGLSVMQVVKALGAVVILVGTSIDKKRLELGKKLGADFIINVNEENQEKLVMELTHGKGADVVMECSGSQSAVNSGIKLLKSEGTYTQVGLFTKPVNMDLDSVVYRKLKIESSIGFIRESWERSIELVRIGKINVKDLISHKLPLTDWKSGFEICENKNGLKVLLTPVD